jgi:hypothetical protein
MEHLSDHELENRAKDIFLNQLVLTEENKIGLHPINQEGEYWMTVFTHLLEEYVIRFSPFPAGFPRWQINQIRIPNPRLDAAAKACEVVRKLKTAPGKYLFKYGQFSILEQLHREGKLRISPAGSYADPSLNPAIQDDELSFCFTPNPAHFKLEVFDGKTGKSKGRLTPENLKIKYESHSNYYVYCLSSIFAPRLFLDFEADACLVIREPKRYVEKLMMAFEGLNPGWIGASETVKYLDPLNPPNKSIDLFSCKHFRYSYQKEVRLIWLPPAPAHTLGHQFLELGNLEDCSELVSI